MKIRRSRAKSAPLWSVAAVTVCLWVSPAVLQADPFIFSFSGNWCCGTPDLGGSNSFTGEVVFDNGNSSSSSQTYDPTTDFVSLTVTSGTYSATLVAGDTTVSAVNANFSTDAAGTLTAGDARFTGGSDTLAGSSDPAFDMDILDNDPDFWDSDGVRHRFTWDMTPMVPVELMSFAVD